MRFLIKNGKDIADSVLDNWDGLDDLLGSLFNYLSVINKKRY